MKDKQVYRNLSSVTKEDLDTVKRNFRWVADQLDLLTPDTNSLVIMIFKQSNYISCINPYPTAFPYGNGMVLHFYQQQESSTTKTVHKVINKGLKTYV